MVIWAKKFKDGLLGNCYEISCEYHDGIIYRANTLEEAVRKYVADRHVNVTGVVEFK